MPPPPIKSKHKSKAAATPASTKWSLPKVSCLNSSFLIDNHSIIALIHFDHFLLMYSALANLATLSAGTTLYFICIPSSVVNEVQSLKR